MLLTQERGGAHPGEGYNLIFIFFFKALFLCLSGSLHLTLHGCPAAQTFLPALALAQGSRVLGWTGLKPKLLSAAWGHQTPPSLPGAKHCFSICWEGGVAIFSPPAQGQCHICAQESSTIYGLL